MESDIQEYTAFSTTFGSFKWLRMTMGLTGSPDRTSLKEHVLVGLTSNITVPYLDDCIIFSKTPEADKEDCNKFFKDFARRI